MSRQSAIAGPVGPPELISFAARGAYAGYDHSIVEVSDCRASRCGGTSGRARVDELVETIRSMVLRLVAEVCLREHGASQRLGLGGTDVRFLTLLDLYGPLTP